MEEAMLALRPAWRDFDDDGQKMAKPGMQGFD
jgi:hypothetical protein